MGKGGGTVQQHVHAAHPHRAVGLSACQQASGKFRGKTLVGQFRRNAFSGELVEPAHRMHQRRRSHAAERAVAFHEQCPRAHPGSGDGRRHACAAAAGHTHVESLDHGGGSPSRSARSCATMSFRSVSSSAPSRQESVMLMRSSRSPKKMPVPGGVPRQGR